MAESRRLAIWNLADRKKPCLMVLDGNRATKVASFNNEETAKLFEEVYNNIIDEVYKRGISGTYVDEEADSI